jgi:hypothetical protein
MKIFNSQRFLAAYSGVLTLIVTVAVVSGFTTDHRRQFDTINVQRINIVEPDGTLRMVLTSNSHLPGVIQHGKEYPDFADRKGRTTAGILFYDAEGSESGGLTFGGRKDEQGRIDRWGHFAFDRYEQDQMLTISAADDGTNYRSRIQFIEQPNWSLVEYLDLLESIQDLPEPERQAALEEFFETHPLEGFGIRTELVNQNFPAAPSNSTNTLRFTDRSNTERMRAGLDDTDEPSIELRDASGNVTYTVPPGP